MADFNTLVQVVGGWTANFGKNVAAVFSDNGDGTGNLIIQPGQGTIARSTAGGPAPGQVLKNYTGTVTLSGSSQTIPLETVTAGRSYLITDVVVTSTNASAILVQITAAGAPIFQAHANSTKGIEAPGIESQPTATTGQAVALVVPSGSGVVAYNIYGIEQ